MKKYQFLYSATLNESNTTISPDKLKIKVIQGIFEH
jgi:hypothetical protein